MVKLSEIDLPVVLEKKLLFGPGKWNDWNIAEDEVLNSIKNTDWNKKSRSIFYSHEDDKAEKWVGSVSNEQLINGKVYGDLNICDADLAFKLTDGEAPFAVSAGIKWPAEFRDPTNFSYRNFSMVINPGVHDEEIYINFADKGKNTFNEAKLIYSKTNFEEKKVEDTKVEEKPTEKINEEIKPIEKVDETPTEKVEDTPTENVVETSTKGVNETSTEESNLNSVERGLKNMVNEEKKTEEKVEETKEDTKVDSVEEEVKEEAKAEFSELKSKLDDAISRIKTLETKQANFEEESESKEEAKEESKEETKEESKEVESKKVEEEEVEEKSETADFTKVVEKLDRVVDALEKKADPMTNAEFSGKSNTESVTGRLTSFLSN